MDSVRIDTGVKRLQINDGPEFIEFNPSDITFAERFYALLRAFEEREAEYTERAKAIDADTGVDAHGIPNNVAAGLQMLRDVCEFMREQIDGLFGAGTSQKVFGDVMSLNMFQQFFDGITPYIRAARQKKVEQYVRTPPPQTHKRHPKA